VFNAGSSAFPAASWNSSNYWVDVVFSTSAVVPPAVTAKTPANGTTAVSPSTTVTATFSQPVVSGTIVFTLKDPSGNVVPASLVYDNTSLTVTLAPNSSLAYGTTYTATLGGAQNSQGATMAPVTWSFTTTSNWSQSTAAAFSAGTQSGTTVVTGASGAGVQLDPIALYDDFPGTSLGASWATTSWASSGGGPTSVTVANSVLSVAGAEVLSTTSYTGTAVEGSVSFGAAPYQHFGIATDLGSFSGSVWALFSTMGTSNTLFARVNLFGSEQSVNLGALPVGFHLYRVQPTATGFDFYVDNVLSTSIAGAFPSGLNPKIAISSFNGAPNPALQVDWARWTGGVFNSSVFDAGRTATWGTVTWTADLPTGTSIVIETSSSTDGTNWSNWSAATNGGTVTSPTGRYLRYRAKFVTSDPTKTPTLYNISFNWS
jgi:hypothetical protein